MKVKEESESRNWIWFKAFEKRLLINLLKAQDFFITWRASLRSIEFWNLSWLWTSFLMKICSLRIRFAVGQGARKKLMSWVSSRVSKGYVVKGFPACFKDGILLCALTEKLVSGSCPRYDLLDPDQPLRNLKLALYLVEKHVKIKPVVTADEILEGGKFMEKRLLLLIAQMKLASEKFNLSANSLKLPKDFLSHTTFVSENCFARGMGLLLAVRNRKACFTIILLESTDNLDMVIEIRGPKNTACSKRITNIFSLTRSDSSDIRDIKDAQIREDILSKKIPLTYRILGRKITVSYTPLESGTHHMSIIWQGQHIMGSPYTITVDSSIESPDVWYMPPKRSYSLLRRSDSQYFDESIEYGRETSLASCPESEGTITRKKILRYIVKIDGNDVVIDGKEDLCKAIKSIRQQHQNSSTYAVETFGSYEQDSDVFSKSESGNIKKTFKDSRVPCLGYDALSINSNTANKKQDIEDSSIYTNKSSVYTNKTEIDKRTDFDNQESKSMNYDRINAIGCLNSRDLIQNTDINSNENKNTEQSFECRKMNINMNVKPYKAPERLDVCESFDKKQEENKIQSIKSAKDVYNQENNLYKECPIENKPKLKVSFSDEKNVESELTVSLSGSSNTFLNNNSNSDPNKYLIPPTDEINFFPVHKVEYEILQDDDDDIEDHNNCNPKRRRSFTELNEINYLDEDVNDTEPVVKGLVNFDGEKEDTEKGSGLAYHSELKSYDVADIRDCLRTNHSLFQCDHSLSFWSETVVETPPEYTPFENNEHENLSGSNTWENELQCLGDKSLLADVWTSEVKCKSSESDNAGFTEKDSPSTAFREIKDSDRFDPFEHVDLNKSEIEEYDLNKKPSLQDLPDSRKRLSWSDRDILPSIRESSVEGLLESETESDKIRNKEMSVNNAYFSATKSDPQHINDPSSTNPTVARFDEKSKTYLTRSRNKGFQPFSEQTVNRTERLGDMETNRETNNSLRTIGESEKAAKLEDLGKSAFSSMNILSASPYKNRNESSKHAEIRFSTATNVEKPPTQILPNNDPPIEILSTNELSTSSNSQNASEDFILTYATPVILDEFQNINGESNTKHEMYTDRISDETSQINQEYADSHEQKSAQCLSVKKVIQIFQKEKEEPVDTWPTEIKNSKTSYNRQNVKEDILNGKTDGKNNNSRNSENCPFTPFVEISRSSIKDRVKLFESDKGKNSPLIRKNNSPEKRAISTINAKKNYWENMAS